ncbi:MAG TPA: Ig-like domain-containing protein [Candidatus Acidoferrales bacterium]|jgi:hypothetical protein|nr:Ig-like domain-containing protein [Candidatus Acidoferrales bacterium]
MNEFKFSWGTRLIAKTVLIGLLTAASLAHATFTFWTGPVITFVHPANTNLADMLTTNHVGTDSTKNVWLTRDVQHPLYNIAAEAGWNGITPSNTLWSLASPTGLPPFPPLTTAGTNIFDTFANVVGHPGGFPGPGRSVGKTFYVKIITDNIILSLKLDAWGNDNGGTFTYERSTPAVVVPPPPTPSISITNPAGGTVFAAPATVNIGANATVSSGTVTNVQLFTNNVSFLSLQSPPFLFTANNLAAGAYALTAAATAAGISATSAAVNISVVTPVTVSLGGTVKSSATNFQFSYPANVGLTYVIERATSLAPTNWVRLATNTAASNPVIFMDFVATNTPGFYRVGRLPNP